LKSNEEKLKYAGLDQEIGFADCIFGHFADQAQQSCALAREECNKYDLTAAP
jgi:hypothetical protein